MAAAAGAVMGVPAHGVREGESAEEVAELRVARGADDKVLCHSWICGFCATSSARAIQEQAVSYIALAKPVAYPR